jgi:hypothetical protein
MNDELISDLLIEMFPIVLENEIYEKYAEHDFSADMDNQDAMIDESNFLNSTTAADVSMSYRSDARREAPDNRMIKVSINERVIGVVTKSVAAEIAQYLRDNRYALMGDSFMSVVNPIDTLDLKIFCDGGRLVRALFNAKKLATLLGPTSAKDPRPLWHSLTWDMMVSTFLIRNYWKELAVLVSLQVL